MLYYFNHRFLYGLAMLLSRSWLLVIGTGAGALCLAGLYVIFVARYARQQLSRSRAGRGRAANSRLPIVKLPPRLKTGSQLLDI